MKKYFSNSDSSFYLEETIESYQKENIPVPSDLAEITDHEYRVFMVSPDGKTPRYDVQKNSMVWIGVPIPSDN